MKKLTTVLTAIVLFVSASIASPTKITDVSARIKAEFKKDFATVTNESWQEQQDIFVASFKMNEQEYSAAYDEEGNLLCISRYVTKSQLPLSITRALEKKFSDYTISDKIIEVTADGTSYLLQAENEKYSVKVKADGSGWFIVTDRMKKK